MFDVIIPDGTYDLRFVLRRNGNIIGDDTYSIFLYTAEDWYTWYEPPIAPGAYNLQMYANDTFIGSASVTVDATPGPSESTTPTATATATPTPTPTPTVTPPGGAKQGDINCDGSITAVDALFILRYVAQMAVNLPGGCPAIGSG